MFLAVGWVDASTSLRSRKIAPSAVGANRAISSAALFPVSLIQIVERLSNGGSDLADLVLHLTRETINGTLGL